MSTRKTSNFVTFYKCTNLSFGDTSTVYHMPKWMRCHKAILVITERVKNQKTLLLCKKILYDYVSAF